MLEINILKGNEFIYNTTNVTHEDGLESGKLYFVLESINATTAQLVTSRIGVNDALKNNKVVRCCKEERYKQILSNKIISESGGGLFISSAKYKTDTTTYGTAGVSAKTTAPAYPKEGVLVRVHSPSESHHFPSRLSLG